VTVVHSARCGCPSEGDDRVTLTAHRPGCGFLEELAATGGLQVSGPETEAPQPEPSPAARALAATYAERAGGLAEIDELYSRPLQP
jgi:hypothetical protein